MYILLPDIAFNIFKLYSNDPKFHLFDIRKMMNNMQIDFLRCHFVDDVNGKHQYSNLPNIVRYFISEHDYKKQKFNYEDYIFVFKDEDILLLTIQYCEKMLEYYPDHIKTAKILKKIKTDNPDLFI